MRSIKTFKFKYTTNLLILTHAYVKVIEGGSYNYRVDDCDWLIAGKTNVYSECEQTLGGASATNNVCAGG